MKKGTGGLFIKGVIYVQGEEGRRGTNRANQGKHRNRGQRTSDSQPTRTDAEMKEM